MLRVIYYSDKLGGYMEFVSKPITISSAIEIELSRLGIETPRSVQFIDPKVVDLLQSGRLVASGDPSIFTDSKTGKEYIIGKDQAVMQGVFYPSISEVIAKV